MVIRGKKIEMLCPSDKNEKQYIKMANKLKKSKRENPPHNREYKKIILKEMIILNQQILKITLKITISITSKI